MTYDLGDIASILAVEMIEVDNPVLVTRHELRQDSEGAGFRRSGLGGIREIEFVGAGGATLSLMGESAVLPRMGMCGGYPGALNVFKVRRSGEEFHPGPIPSKLAGYPLERGDTVVGKTRGCGGWGDPLTREIERVEQDVAQGYISVERANGAYGVVFTHGSVDRQATEELRRLRSAGRIHAVIESTDSDSHNANYCRICRVSADLALALGVDDGDLIEYVPVGACRSHLKAWVSIDDALTGRVTSLGPVGRSILGVEPGGSVWIRPLLPHGATNP
jgi:N-methylhydantoinase B